MCLKKDNCVRSSDDFKTETSACFDCLKEKNKNNI